MIYVYCVHCAEVTKSLFLHRGICVREKATEWNVFRVWVERRSEEVTIFSIFTFISWDLDEWQICGLF